MSALNQSPGRTAIIDGKEHLFFSGYSYLGMSHVIEFIELVKEGIDKYGVLFPSSRISNTQLGIFETMEAFLSQLTSQEETVIYSSGFLAGRAVVDALYKIGAKCFAAPATHAAVGITAEDKKTFYNTIEGFCAEEEIRTPTPVTALPPQSSASTNFATSA